MQTRGEGDQTINFPISRQVEFTLAGEFCDLSSFSHPSETTAQSILHWTSYYALILKPHVLLND